VPPPDPRACRHPSNGPRTGADRRGNLEYEEAIRDLLLAEPERFSAEDVSDLLWTEIDFPEDVVRARDEILPQLADA
jgi:choline kinase